MVFLFLTLIFADQVCKTDQNHMVTNFGVRLGETAMKFCKIKSWKFGRNYGVQH